MKSSPPCWSWHRCRATTRRCCATPSTSLLHDHKVFITDWTDARMVPLDDGPFHLDDYVDYVQEFIRHIGPEVHVISVCQPTVPVLAAVSLMASRGERTPRTMTMMGGPIDARRSPTAVNNLAMNKSHGWFENNVIYRVPPNYPGAGRRVYPASCSTPASWR
jgi:poly(3-hydroxybutyrate) depolymerase